MSKLLKISISYCLGILLCISGNVFGQTGQPDPDFGTNGYNPVELHESNIEIKSLSVQADGKILIAGNTADSLFLARFNSDGELDKTFGKEGILKFIVDYTQEKLIGVLFRQNKYLLFCLVGSSLAIIQININGTRDFSFGTDGKKISHHYCPQKYFNYVSDHKIYFAETYSLPFGTLDQFSVYCFDIEANPVSGFGNDGVAIFDLGKGKKDVLYTFSNQSDGKLILAGYSSGIDGSTHALCRLTLDGKLDSTFGNQEIPGVITSSFGPANEWKGLHILPDDRIIACGIYSVDGTGKINSIVARFTKNGLLDSTFGDKGYLKTWFDNNTQDNIQTILSTKNDKLLLTGDFRDNPWSPKMQFTKIRYNGELDSTFGMFGRCSAYNIPWSTSYSKSILYYNKLYIAGVSSTSIILASYIVDDVSGIQSTRNSEPVILVSPNPAENFITFKVEGDTKLNRNYFINILDAAGRVVISTTTNDLTNYTFETIVLSRGLYFVNIRSDAGQRSIKLILK